jgi:DivIVA domain-containing protein
LKEEFAMAITPQLIKDQEFQIKFRGCDPLEVRDYLESIADEFFELQEQCKEQLNELKILRKAKETSETYNSSLETDMEFTRKISEELKDGCAQKEEKVKGLISEIEDLQLRIADMEQENGERDEEVSAASARIEEAEVALKAAETEKDSLRNKIEMLQEQNTDLKKEEVDFKSTLATAQQFAEDLKEKSKIQAEQMIAEVNAEIKTIRDDAHEELERLPREIDVLKKKKREVKADLKSILESYLEAIEVFYPDDEEEDTASPESAKDIEIDELFQKIELNEDGSLSPEDVEKLSNGSENSTDIANGVLESLQRGDKEGENGDDASNLKDMFSLEIQEVGEKPSS